MKPLNVVRSPVASTSIASVGFSREAQVLEVEFLNGSVYRYFDVALPIFEQLLGTESKGAFFNRVIRGRYSYSRMGFGRTAK